MFHVVLVACALSVLSCLGVLFLTIKSRAKSHPLSSIVNESSPGTDRLISSFNRAHVIVFQSFFIAFTVLELTKVIFGIDLVGLLRRWIGQ